MHEDSPKFMPSVMIEFHFFYFWQIKNETYEAWEEEEAWHLDYVGWFFFFFFFWSVGEWIALHHRGELEMESTMV